MEWIKCSKYSPSQTRILVSCKKCKMAHTVFYDYGEFCMAECCSENGPHFAGESVKFDYWMPLPEIPEENGEK